MSTSRETGVLTRPRRLDASQCSRWMHLSLHRSELRMYREMHAACSMYADGQWKPQRNVRRHITRHQAPSQYMRFAMSWTAWHARDELLTLQRCPFMPSCCLPVCMHACGARASQKLYGAIFLLITKRCAAHMHMPSAMSTNSCVHSRRCASLDL